MQVLVGFDRCGVIAVFPKRPLAVLALVVFLRGATGDELHALGNNVRPCVFHQKVDVVGCHHIVEHRKGQSVSWPRTPNANSAVDRAQILIKIFFDDSGERCAKYVQGESGGWLAALLVS